MFSSDDMLGEEKAMNQEVRHIMKTGSSTHGVFLMEWMWGRDGPNFSGSDLLTYGAIYACSDKRHVMVASCSEVSEVLGLGKRLDMSAITRLEEHEFIFLLCSRPTGGGGRRVRGYALNADAMFEAQDKTPCNRPDGYRLKVSEHKLVVFAKKEARLSLRRACNGSGHGCDVSASSCRSEQLNGLHVRWRRAHNGCLPRSQTSTHNRGGRYPAMG